MSLKLDFSGRTVLVVGGSSGIGNGIARAFSICGAGVHVWGTRPSEDDYAGEAGSDLSGLAYECMDVADASLVQAYVPPFQSLDVLVQCQGTAQYGRAEYARDGWNRVLDVNLNSVMWVATKFRTMLAETRGSMVIVSSVAGFKATIGNPAYAASKTGLVGLTRTLGAAWIGEGVRVNGVAPGLVDTKLTTITTSHPKRLAGALAGIPAGRMGTPGDMAGPVLFLASDLASYVVGQTLIVDGGMTLA